jgi:exopolyphosphatase/guanosine-5'-triphosphate,3'-diphosphate pyrophosphatase
VTRVGVIDVGTNSTRLLVADVEGGKLTPLERHSIVTRLGEGLERSGRLGDEPMARVRRALDEYTELMDGCDVEVRTGVLTSAVRDADNGDGFLALVRDEYGIDAETISGDDEARLTYAGATSHRDGDEPVLVLDIGGGSTELVAAGWHTSLQVGVVRHGERFGDDVEALREDIRPLIRDALPADAPTHLVAVAGTPTQAAAMDLELETYDADRIEGHVLSLGTIEARLAQLRELTLEQRKQVTGLHPDRAPVIVPGLAILTEVLTAAGADRVEVSDRDLLYGRALAVAGSTG